MEMHEDFYADYYIECFDGFTSYTDSEESKVFEKSCPCCEGHGCNYCYMLEI